MKRNWLWLAALIITIVAMMISPGGCEATHLDLLAEQTEINCLVSFFLEAKFSLIEFRAQLGGLDSQLPYVEIELIDDLETALRELGLEEEHLQEIIAEEVDHYYTAGEWGFNPRIKLQLTIDPEDETRRKLNVLVVYAIPESMDDERVRQGIIAVSLAPENPSEDDLAKIPPQFLNQE